MLPEPLPAPCPAKDTLRGQQQLQVLQEWEGTSCDPAGVAGGRAKAHVGVILWFTRWHPGCHWGWRLAAKHKYLRGADPTALTLLLGNLPLPMAWGCTGTARSIQFLQAEEAQGTARAGKESLIHEPDVPWCPHAGGDEEGREKQFLVLGRAVGGSRDTAQMGLGDQRCFQGALQGGGRESLPEKAK